VLASFPVLERALFVSIVLSVVGFVSAAYGEGIDDFGFGFNRSFRLAVVTPRGVLELCCGNPKEAVYRAAISPIFFRLTTAGTLD